MATSKLQGKFKPKTARFGSATEDEIEKLMEERGAKNTNKSVRGAVRLLNEYIAAKSLPELESIEKSDLPCLLKEFYTNVRTKEGERYHLQSLKSMRSNLNRWFQEKKNINIITDPIFGEANLRFKAVQVNTKKIGKAVTKKTEKISDEDMIKLSNYFNVDHMNNPNPAVLQKCVIFNILYFLCRRGHENLYEMTDSFHELIVASGDRFVVQAMDELDKNHRENTTEIPNQGRMYEIPGKN